jgi:hypothetical protein
MTHGLYQQPGRIAARTQFFLQRFLAGENAGFHANSVFNFLIDFAINGNQKVNDIYIFIDGQLFNPFS